MKINLRNQKYKILVGALSAISVLTLSGNSNATIMQPKLAAEPQAVGKDIASKINLRSVAIPFEQNQSVFPKEVAYLARTFAGNLFVTTEGKLVHSFHAPKSSVSNENTQVSGWSLVESFVGSQSLNPSGVDEAQSSISRFHGDRKSQATNKTFQAVRLGQAWEGIDVSVHARGNNVEKIFTVSPGADPSQIEIALDGAQSLSIDPQGALVMQTGNGPVTFTPPIAYQDIDGERQSVEVAYALTDNGYTFSLGEYDSSNPLVIDPLLQATYLGGSANDSIDRILLAQDKVFVVGMSHSADFPGTAGGAQPNRNNVLWDLYVARLNSDLTVLEKATYLGGTDKEDGYGDYSRAPYCRHGITIDASGNIYIAAKTFSNNFPGTGGSAQPGLSGKTNAVVAKLSFDLDRLIQASYFGGNNDTAACAIAYVSDEDEVVIAGNTNSTNLTGTASSAQSSLGGGSDGFVARFASDLKTIKGATYLGGRGDEYIADMLVDGDIRSFALMSPTLAPPVKPSVYLVGATNSGILPDTSGAPQGTLGGKLDGLIAKVSRDLKGTISSTYLGGSEDDFLISVARHPLSNTLYVTGESYSNNFPFTTGGAQASKSGWYDGVMAGNIPLSLKGGGVIASYFGGSENDMARALTIRDNGDVYIAGTTTSSAAKVNDLPKTDHGIQANPLGLDDGFVARFSADLSRVYQASYLGGQNEDSIRDIAFGRDGNLYVGGFSYSDNLIKTLGGASAAKSGGADGMLGRMMPSLREFEEVTLEGAVSGSSAIIKPHTNITMTATITGLNPSGTISFRAWQTRERVWIPLCNNVSLVGVGDKRTATCSNVSLPEGWYGFWASYSGDSINETKDDIIGAAIVADID